MKRRVVVETPFAGDVAENRRYLRLAMRDCLLNHGEAPFASHELYTRCLDDLEPAEREVGIVAGFAWGVFAAATIVYTDRGVSAGMKLGIAEAVRVGRPVEYRTVPGYVAAVAIPLRV